MERLPVVCHLDFHDALGPPVKFARWRQSCLTKRRCWL